MRANEDYQNESALEFLWSSDGDGGEDDVVVLIVAQSGSVAALDRLIADPFRGCTRPALSKLDTRPA